MVGIDSYSVNRRNVLKNIGAASVGLVTASGVGTAKAKKNQYQGIAYDPTTETLLGNVTAKLKKSNDKELRGAIEFTKRKNTDPRQLTGDKLPNHAKPTGISWESLPTEIEKSVKKSERKKQKRRQKRINKKSVNLLNGKVPIAGRRSEIKSDGTVFYDLPLGGKFNRFRTPSSIKMYDTGGQIIGEFVAPNDRQRVAFTLAPAKSEISRSSLAEVYHE